MEACMKPIPLALILIAAACAPPADTNRQADANAAAASVTPAAPAPALAAEAGSGSADAGKAPAPPAAKAPPAAPADENYSARGQEPGWALKIDTGRIDYQGNYGEKRIEVARPEPQPTANGRRYATERLTVVIVYKPCNDAMSGHGYAHEVTVIAEGETYRGCGGGRQPNRDM
jgi:uncharacterized membrane protein